MARRHRPIMQAQLAARGLGPYRQPNPCPLYAGNPGPRSGLDPVDPFDDVVIVSEPIDPFARRRRRLRYHKARKMLGL